MLLADFVPREHTVAAAEALVEVFVTHGDVETPAKGRMKFVLDRLGEAAFRAAWDQAFAARRMHARRPSAAIDLLPDADRVAILEHVPPGGWSAGVRPQRTAGRALLTIDVPMGDTNGSEVELLADLADRHGDGHLVLGRDQDVVLRNVPLEAITDIRDAIRPRGLFLRGDAHVARIRACTGSAVCALGITTAPDAGNALLESPGLGRNSALRVHVSGCPNSCAQHQAADIGLAGSKVRVDGQTRDGYHLYLGARSAPFRAHAGDDDVVLGEVVGRVATERVPAAIEAVVGAWEALRHPGEGLGEMVARLGHDAIAAHVAAVLDRGWETGPEPELAPTTTR